MKICQNCGIENVDEAQFCRNCGANLSVSSPVSQKSEVVKVSENRDSLITKIFYKEDKYDGGLRIAKAKTVSIIVFVAMFLFGISLGASTFSAFVVLIVALIFALVFAVPTFVIGWIVGMIIDRISH